MEALTYLREEILVLMARTEDGEARVQEGREAGMMGDMEGMLDGQVVEDVEAVVVVVVEEEVETGAGLGEEMVEVRRRGVDWGGGAAGIRLVPQSLPVPALAPSSLDLIPSCILLYPIVSLKQNKF